MFSLILSSQHDCQHWLLSAVQQICCWALVPAIDQYLLSTGRSAANPLAACCCRSMGQTAWGQMDIQTDAQALRNRAPDTMQAMSINLAMGKRNPTYRCGMPAAGFSWQSEKHKVWWELSLLVPLLWVLFRTSTPLVYKLGSNQKLEPRRKTALCTEQKI